VFGSAARGPFFLGKKNLLMGVSGCSCLGRINPPCTRVTGRVYYCSTYLFPSHWVSMYIGPWQEFQLAQVRVCEHSRLFFI
jgi:hypothetical protein